MDTVLSLCDYTGNWPRFYEEAGYNVIKWDLKTGQDVRLMKRLDVEVHGILAAPPCTVFANSGARWARTEEEMIEGLSIVDACLRAVVIYNPKWWALENPVGKLKHFLGEPTFKFHPCDFGDPYTKRTYLWGNFNTGLELNPVTPEGHRYGQPNTWYSKVGGASAKTKEYRSATPLGFARAFFEANP